MRGPLITFESVLLLGVPLAGVASLLLLAVRLMGLGAISWGSVILPIVLVGLIVAGWMLFDLLTWLFIRRRSRGQ